MPMRREQCSPRQNAKTGGMQADLKLSSSDYSLVLSIFFVVSGTRLRRPAPADVPGLPPQRGPVQHDPFPFSPEFVPADHHVLLGRSYDDALGPGHRSRRAGRHVDRSQGGQLARRDGRVQGEGLLLRHQVFNLTHHSSSSALSRRASSPVSCSSSRAGTR